MAISIKKSISGSKPAHTGGVKKPPFDSKSAEERINQITEQISALIAERYEVKRSILLNLIYPYVPGDRLIFSSRGKEIEGILQIEKDVWEYPALYYYPIKKDGSVSASHRLLYNIKDILRRA